MLQSKTRWFVKNADLNKVNHLVEELNITPLVATLLVNRGIETIEEARWFLNPEEVFHDPFALKDMDLCVERIHQAINNNEKIVVYGDYDADGVSSTVVMLKALKELGADCDYYIPNRFTEGYGPNEAAFRYLKEQGFDLIITVDNGIAALHEAQVAKEIGIDLIITDHHEPGSDLPEALAIIHPKRSDSNYPFQDLAGVGVAFKVATALLQKTPTHLLPYVAIGTIADLVPLTGENRVIAKMGLQKLKTTNEVGLLSLFKQTKVNQEDIIEDTVGFSLAPRINAPGRLEDAGIVVELFMTDDFEQAAELAIEIDEINKLRQDIVNEMTNEAMELVNETQKKYEHPVIIVGKEGWHPGVIGIVASRLVEKFYRPVFVFSIDEETGLAKGSARSIPGFHLYDNLSECRDILVHYGGHPMAAGLTLNVENIKDLQIRLNKLARLQLTDEDFVPITELDGEFGIEDTTIDAITQMQSLAPFGISNPKPQIMIKNVQFPYIKKVGADFKHMKFTISNGTEQLDGIAFGMGHIADRISSLSSVEVIGELGINEWNNIRKPQLTLKDLRIQEWQLFDYRGNRKLDQWVDTIPTENRKFIVFNEDFLLKLQNDSLDLDWVLVDSEDKADAIELENSHVVLIDFPISKTILEKLLQNKNFASLYVQFYKEDSKFLTTIPSRDHFKWYYAFLMKRGLFDINRNGNDLAKYKGWSPNTIHFMTKVFFELEFVTINNGIISIINNVKKRDLIESKTYQNTLSQIQLEKDLLYSSYHELKQWFDKLLHVSKFEEAQK